MYEQLLPNELLFIILKKGGRNLAFTNHWLYEEASKINSNCNNCNCILFPQLTGIKCYCRKYSFCLQCNNEKLVDLIYDLNNFDIIDIIHFNNNITKYEFCKVCDYQILCDECPIKKLWFAKYREFWEMCIDCYEKNKNDPNCLCHYLDCKNTSIKKCYKCSKLCCYDHIIETTKFTFVGIRFGCPDCLEKK